MELRAYWTIIWRRFWLVVLIVGLVGLYVGYQYYHLRKTPGALTAYSSNITIQIGLQASANGADPSYADNVVTSEALADELITSPILSSKEFDTQVSQQISADMPQLQQQYGANLNLGSWQDTGAIGGALSATRAHSLVTITATWPQAQGAKAIATAVGEVSTSNMCAYVEYVVSKNVSCSTSTTNPQPGISAQVISNASDPATVPGNSTNKVTLLFILLFVALLISIFLAFLADYLDDRIHTRDDVTHLLQLPIYGEVPRPPAVGRAKAKV